MTQRISSDLNHGINAALAVLNEVWECSCMTCGGTGLVPYPLDAMVHPMVCSGCAVRFAAWKWSLPHRARGRVFCDCCQEGKVLQRAVCEPTITQERT